MSAKRAASFVDAALRRALAPEPALVGRVLHIPTTHTGPPYVACTCGGSWPCNRSAP